MERLLDAAERVVQFLLFNLPIFLGFVALAAALYWLSPVLGVIAAVLLVPVAIGILVQRLE